MTTSSTGSAGFYLDFQNLAKLKNQTSQSAKQANSEVAQQFEALFLQTMLKTMRAATPGDGFADNDHVKLYQELFDKQIALDLSRRGGIGIADIIERQLQPQPAPANTPSPATMRSLEFASKLWTNPSAPTAKVPMEEAPLASANAKSGMQNPNTLWDSPEEFVSSLLPAARKAAKELGTEPEAILAIAALETGWGKHVMQNRHGLSSYNLFGIKATDSASEDQVTVTTLEFRNGAMEKTLQPFRTYSSASASVADFSKFIRDNPRYSAALEASGDPETFIKKIHKAGYATDPDYAEKVVQVFRQIQHMTKAPIAVADNSI